MSFDISFGEVLAIVAIMIVSSIAFSFAVDHVACPEVKVVCMDGSQAHIDAILEEIDRNCGSTFITTKYGEEGWFVFAQKCQEGGYCKPHYYRLEDCFDRYEDDKDGD